MSLPAAIQKQVEDADRIQAALAGTPEPTPTEDSPAPAAAEDSTPTPTGDTAKQPEASPPAEPRPKKSFDKDDEDTWRQRYFGLQGVFNAQVPSLQQQVRDLTSRLVAAEAQIQAPTAAEPKATQRVTEKDVEAFGSDLIDVIDRKAQEVVERQAAAYEGRIAELEQALVKAKAQIGDVTQTQAQTAKERFFAHLDTNVPSWNDMQGTSEAQAWLGTKVPGTQWTWDDVLKDAAANHDGQRAVEVFTQFQRQHPQFAPQQSSAPSKSRQELQRQVAPAKSSSASAPSQSANTKRVFTSAEYGSEMNKVVRLNMQGRYDEAKRIESELDAAMAEGRIRP